MILMQPFQIFVRNSVTQVSAAKEAKVNFDGGPARLKGGSGEGVVSFLCALSDKAVASSGWVYARPTHKAEDFAEEATVDHDAEVVAADEIDERVQYAAEDDSEEMFVGSVAARKASEK